MFTARLEVADVPMLRAHFLALGSDDRRLRFGFAASDTAIKRYVEGIDFERDAVFGVQGDSGQLDGVTHLALENTSGEIGVSVLEPVRGRGVGSALVSRAAVHARNRAIRILFMQCLTENRPIMRIARALGMQVVTTGNDSEATLALPAADGFSILRELMADQMALCDATLKERSPQSRPRATGTLCPDDRAVA